MGLLTLVHSCSHLQNAARARLAITSIPVTRYNLNLALALHRSGYISSITRGGVHPPELDSVMPTEPPPIPDQKARPFSDSTEPLTHANISKARLWLGLKYWEGKPVMTKVSAVSTPKRKVTLKLPSLEKIVRGLPADQVSGLKLGESLFLTTDIGVLEVREALERHRGGLLLCRVS